MSDPSSPRRRGTSQAVSLVLALVVGLTSLLVGDPPAHADPVRHLQPVAAPGTTIPTFWYKTSATFHGEPVWYANAGTCMGEGVPGLMIWKECMSWRVYKSGGYIWGKNHANAGLRGAHICHSDGSYGYGFTHTTISCGEHNYSAGKMKQWYSWDECTLAGNQCNYRAMHVYFYASGAVTGPYEGLGP